MENCIFCNIARGRIPSFKVYEDDIFFAFLDIHPRTKGHTLLIPKKHYQWVYDVPEFEKYWGAAHAITKAMQKTLNPKFVSFVTHGLEVPHAHIHIMPRSTETQFVPPQISVSAEDMKTISKKIYDQTTRV